MTEKITAAEFVIGIDSGVNTDFACWSIVEKRLIFCKSLMIHQAFDHILGNIESITLVRVEDARLRKYITGGREKLQGAGSIKRDAKIWEDFLTDKSIPFEMVAPKNNRTKLDHFSFKKITGYKSKTNQHARDAAMLVFGFNKKI